MRFIKHKYLAICISYLLGNFNMEAMDLLNSEFSQNSKDEISNSINSECYDNTEDTFTKNNNFSIQINALTSAINELISNVKDNKQLPAEKAAQKVYDCFHAIVSKGAGNSIFGRDEDALNFAIRRFNNIFMDSFDKNLNMDSFDKNLNKDSISNLINSIESIKGQSWFRKHDIHKAFTDNFKELLVTRGLQPESLTLVVNKDFKTSKNKNSLQHVENLSKAIDTLISDVYNNKKSKEKTAQALYDCFHTCLSMDIKGGIFNTSEAAMDNAIKIFNGMFMKLICLKSNENFALTDDFINNLIDSIASIKSTSWFGTHNVHEAFMDNFKVLLFRCDLLPKSIATVVKELDNFMNSLKNTNGEQKIDDATADENFCKNIKKLKEAELTKGNKMGNKFAYSVFHAIIYGYLGLKDNKSKSNIVVHSGIDDDIFDLFKFKKIDGATANFIYDALENSMFENIANSYFNELPEMFSYLKELKEGPVTPEVFKLKQAMDDILDKYNSKQSMNLLKEYSQNMYTDIFKKKASSDLGKACSELKKSLAFFISYTHQDEKKAQFIVKVLEALSEIESSGLIKNTVSTAFRDTVKDYLEKYKKKLERDRATYFNL